MRSTKSEVRNRCETRMSQGRDKLPPRRSRFGTFALSVMRIGFEFRGSQSADHPLGVTRCVWPGGEARSQDCGRRCYRRRPDLTVPPSRPGRGGRWEHLGSFASVCLEPHRKCPPYGNPSRSNRATDTELRRFVRVRPVPHRGSRPAHGYPTVMDAFRRGLSD